MKLVKLANTTKNYDINDAHSIKKRMDINKIIQDQKNKTKVADCEIVETNTVNGIRFSLSSGSWGLIRASSNKPSLVIVIESLVSNEEVEMIFKYINTLINETGKVGEYDQKL